MRKFNIRKTISIALIGVGTILVLYYVPLWVWYVVLGVLCILFIFTLFRIYL